MKSSFDAILKRKGSKCTCPICDKPCEGGTKYLKTGKLVGGDTKGCKHYDGWSYDKYGKELSHYFVK